MNGNNVNNPNNVSNGNVNTAQSNINNIPQNINNTQTNMNSIPQNNNPHASMNISQNINNTQTNINSIPQNVNATQTNIFNNTNTGNSYNNQGQPINNQNVEVLQSNGGVDNNQNNDNPDINYKPPGKFKIFVLIVFFFGLVAFVIFLPEIQAYVDEYVFGNSTANEEITSGKLVCKLDSNTTNLDKSFERIFSFQDKKLTSAKFVTTTKGDVSLDENTLNEINNTCNIIKQNVSSIKGVDVSCLLESGKMTETETFDYKLFDFDTVTAAYTEAGGEVIEYEYGYDIDKINTMMLQAGYSCSKEK